MAAGRVVDVEDLLIGREGKAVRPLEVVDQQVQPALRVDPEDAVERQLLPLDAAAQAVRRVGEVDRAVRADDDVVGAVQLLALVVRRQHLAPAARPIRVDADDARGRVLAHDQAPVGAERHPVALVARARDDADAALLVPAPPRVGRHVGEEQEAVRIPDRALGEGEAAAELLDLDVLVDELGELLGSDV